MKEAIRFSDAQSAQNYAKNNPGAVVTRSEDGEGFTVKGGEEVLSRHKTITPKSMLTYLDQHVIGQNEAKEEIALALYYHYVKYEYREIQSIRNNGPLMLIGPTGSGKTFIVQKACECIEIPFIHVDTASMVPEGIVGYCLSDLMADILYKAGYDRSKAEHAVVFFDEVDKLFDNGSEYGKKIAQQMLRLIEGDSVKLNTPKVSKKEEFFRELNTSHMQFIFGGAFQWLWDSKKIIAPVMGFGTHQKSENCFSLSIEDLYSAGVAKEFLGRINTVVTLNPLSQDDIYNVLKKSQSSPLGKYIEKIIRSGSQVIISDETYREIAVEAANHPLGVRSLDSILKRLFKAVLFCAPEQVGQVYDITYK